MSAFATTRWSLLLAARQDDVHASAALSGICAQHRRPVLDYIRRAGHSQADAEDLTQAFFVRFLERRADHGADPARGRFRQLLRVQLRHVLCDAHAAAHAIKRGGGMAAADESVLDQAADPALPPERSFDRGFALSLIDRALARLREQQSTAASLGLFDALLTSPYILIAEENIPSVRGASQAYGLSFTPGTWVESIQITKGAGSVVNGYESISGQINTELIKPLKDIPFFLNAYGSTDSRFELNTLFNKKINEEWATSLFIHGNARVSKNDMNHDNFLDNPLGKQINLTNRWQYASAKTGWVSFFNLKYMKDEKQTGEVDFDPKTDKLTTNNWGSEINTERADFASKIGYVFKEAPYQSIGFHNAFSLHNQDSYFGLNQYNIKQQSFYSNAIFNSIISNTRHKFSTGLNFAYDKYAELFQNADLGRIDYSIGTFFEYTFDDNDKLSYAAAGAGRSAAAGRAGGGDARSRRLAGGPGSVARWCRRASGAGHPHRSRATDQRRQQPPGAGRGLIRAKLSLAAA